MTLRHSPHRGRSKRPHRLDARIAEVERELRRLRAIRHSDLSADAARDPHRQRKMHRERDRAWASPTKRASMIAAMAAAWTPARRAAQAERMRAAMADPQRKAKMLAGAAKAIRTPEHRERCRIKSAEVFARTKAEKAQAREAATAADPVEAAIFGGGT